MKIENVTWVARDKQFDTMLWDTKTDPDQQSTLDDLEVEERLKMQMVALMKACHSPAERFERLQINPV